MTDTLDTLNAALDGREAVVAWYLYLETQKARCVYTEGVMRMIDVHACPATGEIYCDCSACCTYCFSWAGCVDPNGLNFDGEGYTGTLLSHDQHVSLFVKSLLRVEKSNVQPGDLVVYGAGTGIHVAMIVGLTNPADPETLSMGEQGDPSFIDVAHGNPDPGSPVTYLRPSFALRPGVTAPIYPSGYQPKPVPAPKPAPDPKPTPQPEPTPAPVPTPSPTPKPVPTPAPQPTPVPAKIPSADTVLKFGSKGWEVRWIQRKMGQLPTGIFGKRTLAALISRQWKNGLPKTGETDRPTWKTFGVG